MCGCLAMPTPSCWSICWRSGFSSHGPNDKAACSSVSFSTTALARRALPSKSMGKPTQLTRRSVFVSLMWRVSFRMPSRWMTLCEMSRSVTQSYLRSHSSKKTKSSSSITRFDKCTVVIALVRKRQKSIPGLPPLLALGHIVGPIPFTVRSTHCGLPNRLCAKALAPSFCTSFRLKLRYVKDEFKRRKWARNMAPTTSMP
mmetsp:Transcript_83574/g.233274  ORF Transcript_83574/g.233274 Transcript_83574/m.233274 type:complete len:200 (-) Transcript_83574:669-1268(-)